MRFKDLKPGMKVVVTIPEGADECECLYSGEQIVQEHPEHGIFLKCHEGEHYLSEDDELPNRWDPAAAADPEAHKYIPWLSPA